VVAADPARRARVVALAAAGGFATIPAASLGAARRALAAGAPVALLAVEHAPGDRRARAFAAAARRARPALAVLWLSDAPAAGAPRGGPSGPAFDSRADGPAFAAAAAAARAAADQVRPDDACQDTARR
jgi:hypothetical protein